jgi:vacuolar-type H+-ATPase subunit F/Vma7
MSKSKKNYRAIERDYYDGEEVNVRYLKNNMNKKKEKRVDRALRTKNVDALVEIEDEGLDPIDYEYNEEYDLEMLIRERNS